jgi:hypothetical protein
MNGFSSQKPSAHIPVHGLSIIKGLDGIIGTEWRGVQVEFMGVIGVKITFL